MSDEEKASPDAVGRLTGKTTTHTVQILFTNPEVERTSYFVIYTEKKGAKPHFILYLLDMWSDSKGMMGTLYVLGDRPKKPFDVGVEVFLASEEQISRLLGIYNPPEKSVSLGKLIGYPFDVNLLIKNFGRIFITGKSGSGKSYTMGVLCEEFLKKGIPIVILDRHGEYGSLKVMSDDLEAKKEKPPSFETKSGVCPWCGEEVPEKATTCKHCGKSLESELVEKTKTKDPGASEFADSIIEYTDLKMNPSGDVDMEYLFSLEPTDVVAPRLCSIINLRGLDLEVQEQIAGKLLKKLYQASTSRQIPPFYLFLDEAHLFAGKKQTDTCEVVKLFSQEGRKFGANLVIGTQRPQLLDTTIRAQAGTWVVHNLSDVRDIGITISSAEDLSKENKDDISGLDKGQAIICGEAVSGIPLFVKVRKRRTQHGGIGFNPLDFLSEQTVEELQKRKDKILGKKSADELAVGKNMFQEMLKPKSATDYLEEIAELKRKIQELEDELNIVKEKYTSLEGKLSETGVVMEESEAIEELQTEVNVWKEKYNYLKEMSESQETISPEDRSQEILELQNRAIELEAVAKKYKGKYADALLLAEKTLQELKATDKKLRKK
ncbi:MAG: helicase HerA domain-containing protein [Candidatus Hermodarchaeota archaeon]